MPIGKNALKRVENNGYSKVKSTAPDMENSVVAEEIPVEATPVKKVAAPAEQAVESVPAPKKTAKSKASAPKKKVEETVEAPAQAAEKKAAAPKTTKAKKAPKAKSVAKKPEAAVSVGESLPYYLL